MVVLNSAYIAKEAMVTRYPSILTRKLSKALTIVTCDKSIVAMSDYNEFHKTSKRHWLMSTLGPNAQKRHRIHRDILIDNVCKQFHDLLAKNPYEAINLRKVFLSELFGLSMKQDFGRDVRSLYVEDLGSTLSRDEWIPNRSFENIIQQMSFRREAVTNAIIKEKKMRIDPG